MKKLYIVLLLLAVLMMAVTPAYADRDHDDCRGNDHHCHPTQTHTPSSTPSQTSTPTQTVTVQPSETLPPTLTSTPTELPTQTATETPLPTTETPVTPEPSQTTTPEVTVTSTPDVTVIVPAGDTGGGLTCEVTYWRLVHNRKDAQARQFYNNHCNMWWHVQHKLTAP